MENKRKKNDYILNQEEKQAFIFDKRPDIYDGGKNNGEVSKRDKNGVMHTAVRDFVLQSVDREKNIYAPIRSDVIRYMADKDIRWWCMDAEDDHQVTAHTLSSQVACLNHLFSIRNDDKAIKKVLASVAGIEFDEILPSIIDAESLISFEFTLNNAKLLNENYELAKRGAFMTSVDAMILARKGTERWLIPIEWKYTESYPPKDKTCKRRLDNYQSIFEQTKQLKMPENGFAHSIYFQEPYYELMRQTLLMEQLIREGYADHFIHLYVVPLDNKELRNGVEQNYIPMLNNPALFHVVDPSKMISSLKDEYGELYKYLNIRYWSRLTGSATSACRLLLSPNASQSIDKIQY